MVGIKPREAGHDRNFGLQPEYRKHRRVLERKPTRDQNLTFKRYLRVGTRLEGGLSAWEELLEISVTQL